MLSVDSLIGEIASSEYADCAAFLARFADALRRSAGADFSKSKDIGSGERPSQGEEFILNTCTPYLDNSLSSYSAFPELINYFNSGFKSCLVLPLKSRDGPIGIITLLSRKDRFFQEGDLRGFGLMGEFASHQYTLIRAAGAATALSAYFDSMFNYPIPQCVVDSQGTVLLANPAFEAIAKGPATGSGIAKLLGIDKATLEGIKKGVPSESRLANGRRFMLYPGREGGDAVSIMLYDITEAELMKEREQFFRYAVDEAFMVLDHDTRVRWVSGNMMNVLHIDPDYLQDKRLSNIVKGGESLKRLLSDPANGAASSTLELMLGNDSSVRALCTVARAPDGYLVMLSRNTAEYAESLRKGLDDILRMSGEMVLTLDATGYIKSINKSAENILKYRAPDLSGASISSLCADNESQQRISLSLNIARRSGIVSEVFINLNAKGSETPVPSQHSIRAMYDNANKLSGFVLLGRELETKKKLALLQDLYEKAERARANFKEESELKTQFISSMAHDLRTPITSISGFAKLMLEGQPFGELNDRQKESLQTIIDESARLNELIEHILDAAKLESKKVKLDLRMVNMRELGQNAGVKSQAEVAINKGLAFDYIVDYDVPEVECDPNRIIQVLVNLIGNAIKFTEKGGITVHVRRNGKGRKVKSVRLEVRDTGIGVNREDKAKLFKKFFQIEKNNLVMQPGKGSGLGLTIVKEIVGLHNGKAGVESDLGKGSTFWFTLPIRQKQEGKKEKGASAPGTIE